MATVGKRKKKLPLSPNPLFMHWLNEWREDAAAKGLKSQYTYAKAIQSLKKYPLPVSTGKECKFLENFGDKTCKMLDDTLMEYIAEHGSADPELGGITVAVPPTKPRKKRAVSGGARRGPGSLAAGGAARDGHNTCFSPDSGSEDDHGPGGGIRIQVDGGCRRGAAGGPVGGGAGRVYKPLYRSGPYALIVTLHTHLRETGGKSMSKFNLMKEAQPLSEKSFTLPDPGSRYTAWSSMGTLIKKGFIIKSGSPAQYHITDAGCHLAVTLLQDNADPCGDARPSPGDRIPFLLGNGPPPPQPAPPGERRPSPPARDYDLADDLGGGGPGLWHDGGTQYDVAGCGYEILDLTADEVVPRPNLSERSSPVRKRPTHDISEDDDESLPATSPSCWRSMQGERPPFHDLSDDDDLLPALNPRHTSPIYSTVGVSAYAPSSVSSHQYEPVGTGSGLRFWYIDDCGGRVMSKDQAAVLIDEEISIGFLCECRYEDLLMCSLRYKIDPGRKTTGDEVLAFLHNEDCPEQAQPPDSPSRSAPARQSPLAAVSRDHDLLSIPDTKPCSLASMSPGSQPASAPLSERLKPTAFWEPNRTPPVVGATAQSTASASATTAQSVPPRAGYHSDTERDSQSARSNINKVSHSARSNISKVSQSARSNISKDSQSASNNIGRDSQSTYSMLSRDSQSSSIEFSRDAQSAYSDLGRDSQSTSGTQDLALEEARFVLRPGTFDVFLCVDNCEIYGGGSSSRKEVLVNELKRNQVRHKVCKLQIGDFCWVAQEQSGAGEGRELVLDYVVERKRMDDLAGSIVDGRFREQKFRLKNCGLSHAVYLVESFGSNQHFSIGEDALQQAITNTQVIDGFYVKRTNDTRESAAYLTLMTRYLQGRYANKTLYAHSKATVQKKNVGRIRSRSGVHHMEVQLMTFVDFNNASMKTRALTVKEMFVKQLVQLSGITAEKASAILDKYPTPNSLFEALNCVGSTKDKELLLADIKFGPLQRKIGVNLSKMVCMMYSLAKYP